MKIWEPVLLRLVDRLEGSDSSILIEEIWTWEAVQHGDSGLINEESLGGVCELTSRDMFMTESLAYCILLDDWTDNARDILNFLFHYLPSRPYSKPLPTNLLRVPKDEATARTLNGFSERAIVVVGHSLGAASR